MGASEGGRDKRFGEAMGVVATVLAVAAVACGGATGTTLDARTATPEGAATLANGAHGGLVELQRGLPTGHPSDWYTERLAALDYQVARLRQEDDGTVVYRVVKAGEAFDVRIAVDRRANAARSVQIEPLAGETTGEGAGMAEIGAAASSPTSSPADVVEQQPADSSVAAAGASPRREPELPREAPVETNGAGSESGAPALESRASEPAAGARAPDTADDSSASPSVPVRDRASPPAPPEPRTWVVTVPAGTRVAARLDTDISSARAAPGDAFSMTVREAVWADGFEVLPAGTRVWGYVAEVERAARPNKGGRLVLAADGVELDGNELQVDAFVTTDGARLEGRDSTHEDIKEVAIGAGLGGLVGGILGGKKGVLVGVLAGGGGTFVATKGEEVELAADTPLFVELRRDLNVTFVGPR